MSLLPLTAPAAILIARTDKIGDFVVSIPSYATCKAMFPQAKIIALVSKHNRILAQHVPVIDEVVCLDDFVSEAGALDFAALTARLQALKLDAFVALVSNNTISKLAVASGAKVRVGPRSKPWSFVHYNYGLRQQRSQCIKSEAAYNLDLIAHLNPQRCAQVGVQLQRLIYKPEDVVPVTSFLQAEGLQQGNEIKPFVLINPFTGGSGANLNCAQYGAVINKLLAGNSALEVVLMAMPNQAAKVEQVLADVTERVRVHVYLNQGSLMVATALVERCTSFIGPSTGITQIAGNLGKPAICFYSSRKSNSHTRWALYGDEQEVPVTLPLEALDPVTKEIVDLPAALEAQIVTQTLAWFAQGKVMTAQLWDSKTTSAAAAEPTAAAPTQTAVPAAPPAAPVAEPPAIEAVAEPPVIEAVAEATVPAPAPEAAASAQGAEPDVAPVPVLATAGKPSLTVAIIAHNEQDRLPKTFEQIQDIAAEIILINSCSTDNTVAVAQSYGAKVFTEEFKGYVEQKNSLIPKCTQDWILFLDADEVVNDELKAAIVKAIASGSAQAYEMNRLTFYLGKLLKHAWQPNYRLRLVRRAANPKWVGEIVHESLACDDAVARLPGYIIHYSYRDVNDHFERTIRYAKMSAQSYIKRGKKPSLAKIIFSPVFSFIKLYFIKLGCLDGRAGYIAAQSAFIYTFLKYVFLWEASLGLKSQYDERK